MAGLLDGQLAKAIYAGFRGKLQKGVLWRSVPVQSAGLTSQGDPVATSPVTWDCQGFTENYSDVFRAMAQIPITDVRVNIFGQSIAGVTPKKDDKVLLAGQWWQVRKVDTDPAKALWTMQSFGCSPPPDFP